MIDHICNKCGEPLDPANWWTVRIGDRFVSSTYKLCDGCAALADYTMRSMMGKGQVRKADANDADAASVSVSRFNETGDGDNGAACKANGGTCLTGQAVDKQADSREKLISMQVETIINLQKQVDKLTAENMNLARDLGECMADRDELREKLSTAIAHARCITRLIELG